LATPMDHSGEINGERKRGSRCGDDVWRRGRRGGHEGTTAKEGRGDQDPIAAGAATPCRRQ
jgi:hypothetical protein